MNSDSLEPISGSNVIQSEFWPKEEGDSLGLSPEREVFTTVSQTYFSSLKDVGVWSSWRLRVYMKFVKPLCDRQAQSQKWNFVHTVQGVTEVCTSTAQNCMKGSDAARCLLPWAAFTENN